MRIYAFILFCCTNISFCSFAQNVSIPRGSYIVNLGITPQTIGNGLKPYGLVYDLVTNYNVPVMWVFKQSKAKDANDFHHNGAFYKGSAFVIDSLFLTTTVKNRISIFWNAAAQGVVGAYTAYDTVLPVYNTITYWPKAVMDQSNDQLPIQYYTNAGIPIASYRIGLPTNITTCEDMYVMPHADPTSITASYAPLYNFTSVNKGYVWANCHSVSELEGTKNGTQQLNFLSSSGLQCHKSAQCGNDILQTHLKVPTNPIIIDSSLSGDPLVQLVGDPRPAMFDNGSEYWYIPVDNAGRWNADTRLYVTTSDGAGNRKGTQLVGGYAFGNNSFGRVAYQAGHDLTNRGTEAQQVAAQRVFLNFLLLAAIEKKPNLSVKNPVINSSVAGQTTFSLTANVSGGSGSYTYAWSSPCTGAVFSNPTGSSTNLTLTNPSICRVLLRITDACQRKNYAIVTANTVLGAVLSETSLTLSAKRTSQFIQLEWVQPENKFYDQYIVERSYDGVSYINVSNTSANIERYSIFDQPDLTQKTVYYRLRTTENNVTTYSNTAIVNLNQGKNKIHLFQNPVNDFVQIMDLPKNQPFHITIYGINGNKIIEKTLSNSTETFRLPVSQITQRGIYYIQVKSQNSFDVLKFIKE